MFLSFLNFNLIVKLEDFNEFFFYFEIVVILYGWDFKIKFFFLVSNFVGSVWVLLIELNEI